jgi:hypothetical protein
MEPESDAELDAALGLQRLQRVKRLRGQAAMPRTSWASLAFSIFVMGVGGLMTGTSMVLKDAVLSPYGMLMGLLVVLLGFDQWIDVKLSAVNARVDALLALTEPDTTAETKQ